MIWRTINDAQVDRLLRALRRADNKPGLSNYGKQLAKKIAARSKIAYRSAERRLQRYITGAGESRHFQSAPVRYQRELRQEARRTPPPLPLVKRRPLLPTIAPPPRRVIEPERPRIEAEEIEHTSLYEQRAIIAYFDGDTVEAGHALGVNSRLLDLVSQGTIISRRMGAGRIDEGVRKLYDRLSTGDYQDIQDFSALLYDLPDWRIGLILDDLAEGNITFAEWLDAWHDDDMDIDADDSEFWVLWRAAYKRATGK